MSEIPVTGPADRSERFLAGAYYRILKITLVLSAAALIGVGSVWDWALASAVLAGSVLGSLNFVWLHHGAELVVRRMMTPAANSPSQGRVVFAFLARYMIVLIVAYVILKSYPRVRVAFVVGLALPIISAMFEGIYEAVKISKTEGSE